MTFVPVYQLHYSPWHRISLFVCELGLFHWLIMPYGLCKSPPTFQRIMTMIFEKIFSRYGSLVLCYIDDVIIATETLKDHLVRLREVFLASRMLDSS